MERLTSEKETKEMNMLELSQNCMYVKDDWCRYRDYNIDVGLIFHLKQHVEILLNEVAPNAFEEEYYD